MAFPTSAARPLWIMAGAMLLGAALTAQAAVAAPVALQNATATLSQAGGYNVSTTIDGVATGGAGWAIHDGSATGPQTAVWETAADLSASSLTVQLVQVFGNHLLGRFRLSTTTDDRSTFADGLQNGGDVTATWTALASPAVTSIAGMVFTTLVDNSVLVGGTLPATAVYELTYNVNLVGVTGLRLEAMADAGLPTGGPGAVGNGNFVLTEILVSSATAVPVPAALPLLAGGLGLLGLIGRRRRG